MPSVCSSGRVARSLLTSIGVTLVSAAILSGALVLAKAAETQPAKPATLPSIRPVFEGATHIVTADTALIIPDPRHPSSVSFDTVAAGTRLRLRQLGVNVYVTEDGRVGTISNSRVELLHPPEISRERPRLSDLSVLLPSQSSAILPPSPGLKSPRSTKPAWSTIDNSIDSATKYLTDRLLKKDPKAADEPQSPQTIALIVNAIGEGDSVAPAIATLNAKTPPDTVTACLRAQIWNWNYRTIPMAKDAAGSRNLLDLAVRQKPNYQVFFGDTADSTPDTVSSYWALRGISLVEEAGAATAPDAFWTAASQHWRHYQQADGGWAHDLFSSWEPARSNVMDTFAGILALEIIDAHLKRDPLVELNASFRDPEIESAMGWLNDHPEEVINEVTEAQISHPCETIWWLAQVSLATGARRVGGYDCRATVQNVLVQTQKPNGSWGDSPTETAYALWTLWQLRAPITVAKLHHALGPDNCAWNLWPQDISNFSHFLYHAYCGVDVHNLVVDLNLSEANPLADVSVIFITGNSSYTPTPMEREEVVDFVNKGGLILGSGSNNEFAASFRKLGNELFPGGDFRTLANWHLIFNEMYLASKWKSPVKVEGLSNGVRELMLLVPEADLSRAWNSRTVADKELLELGANIVLYANGKLNFPSQDAPIEPLPHDVTGRAHVRQLKFGDHWNPEPNAWARMNSVLNGDSYSFVSKPAELADHKDEVCNLLHFTGTTAFKFTPEERLELIKYVFNGGTLLIDAAGGSTEFADAAETELKEIFGDSAKELEKPFPIEMLDGKAPDAPRFDKVFRTFARVRLDGDRRHIRLRGIHQGNRLAVIFSREDLTAGMAGIRTDGIIGYDVDTATELVRDIMLYVAAHNERDHVPRSPK